MKKESVIGVLGRVYFMTPLPIGSMMLTRQRVEYSPADRTVAPDHTLLVQGQE